MSHVLDVGNCSTNKLKRLGCDLHIMTIESLENKILDTHNTHNMLTTKIQPIYNEMNINKSGVAINVVEGKVTRGRAILFDVLENCSQGNNVNYGLCKQALTR